MEIKNWPKQFNSTSSRVYDFDIVLSIRDQRHVGLMKIGKITLQISNAAGRLREITVS